MLHEMMLVDSTAAGPMLDSPCPTADSKWDDVEYLDIFGYVEESASLLAQGHMLVCIGKVLKIMEMDPRFHWVDDGPVVENFRMDVTSAFIAPSRPNFPLNHELLMEHFSADGERTAAIKTHFMQKINFTDGIVVAHDILSPIEATQEANLDDSDTIPSLKYWSDVAFLQWRCQASHDSELKHVLRHDVLNAKTDFVVEAINAPNGYDTAPWPGMEYNAYSEDGQALLGTPNGSSVAYMLIQHKKHLGHKTVKKVTVFCKSKKLMLLFHIVDMEV
jgi:hypothetical protein